MHAVMVSENKLWLPIGRDPVDIEYYFIDGTDVQRQKVNKTIPEWCKYGHLKFTEVKDKEDASIRIQFDADNGSWSFVSVVLVVSMLHILKCPLRSGRTVIVDRIQNLP